MAQDEIDDCLQRTKDRLARSLAMQKSAVAALQRSALRIAASKDVLQESHLILEEAGVKRAEPLAPDEPPGRF